MGEDGFHNRADTGGCASPGEVADLVAQITRAFEGAAYPGDERLSESVGEEAAAVVAAFRGKNDWQQLSGTFLDEVPGGWTHFQ